MMTCKICNHPNRKEIDKAIVDQRSCRDIAGQYEISRSSVDRHKGHIPKALTKAKQAETVAETTSLLTRVEKLAARCEAMIDQAEKAEDWRAAPSAARELRGCLELLGKLNGELQANGARVAINFGDVTNIDIRTLTDKQLGALYERLEACRTAEIDGMTTAEIDAELAKSALGVFPGDCSVVYRKAYLFDEQTVPYPGVGDPTWHQRNFENMRAVAIQNGWRPREWTPGRDASQAARLAMLKAAWKQLTGQEMGAAIDSAVLGAEACIRIDFDLIEDHDKGCEFWPQVSVHTMADSRSEVEILPPATAGSFGTDTRALE